MQKLKKELQTDVSAGGYHAPDVVVMEIRTQQMLCQSGTTQEYGDGSTDGWYNN